MKYFLLFVTVLLLSCSEQYLPESSYELSFNSEEWKKEDSTHFSDSGVTIRQQMLGDLINKHLAGKNRQQLIDLLGQSSEKMDPDGSGPSLSYPTGPQRDSYFAIDYEWLIIKFDSSNEYESFYLASD